MVLQRIGLRRALALLVVIVSLTGPVARPVAAQEELSAAIVHGGCERSAEVAIELRPLEVAEGGARTSFSTIDVAIDELTGGGYAILAGDSDEPVACGEIAGEGTDVYVAVPAQGGSTLGGVAWLHARDNRTQVSLFLGENLGQSPATSDNAPPGPPEPVTDETATYTSPNYGYTITYDTERWRIIEDATDSTEHGPEDNFSLRAIPVDDAQADFSGGYWSAKLPATTFTDRYFEQIKQASSAENVAVRSDAGGNPIQGGDAAHAYISIDMTFTDQLGAKEDLNFFIECWTMPSLEANLVLIYISSQSDYDVWAAAREDLVKGVIVPS